ncbi:hypothetical protein HanPI659440_Chr16g0631981 [Helianthus annuus]|nr:hypothetical protein HanPI659440_Chr16g0631981 [Helianthus annuus]
MKTIPVATSVGPRLASDVNQCEPKGGGNSRRDVRASPATAKVLWFGQRLQIKRRSVIVSCGCQDVLWLRDGGFGFSPVVFSELRRTWLLWWLLGYRNVLRVGKWGGRRGAQGPASVNIGNG